MIYRYLTNLDFLLSLLIPIALAYGGYIFIKSLWKKRFEQKDEPLEYKAETFRNPINLSVTAAGLIIPLIAGVMAYLLKPAPSLRIEQISPLIASLCILTIAICFGIWLSYSLATVSTGQDSFTINKTHNWKFPAAFVAQLILFLSGIILIAWFFTFRFDQQISYEGKNTTGTFEVLRQRVLIGATEQEVLNQWGSPFSIQNSEDGSVIHYIYNSPSSIYTISFRNGAVVSFLEQKSNNLGDKK